MPAWYRRSVLSQLPPATLGGLWAVISLYGLAHLLPTLYLGPSLLSKDGSNIFGLNASMVAAAGAIGSLQELKPDWLMIFGWLPNPLLWFGWTLVAIARPGELRLAGFVAGVAGALAVVGASLWLLSGSAGDLQVGYYMWFASMIVLALVGFLTATVVRSPSSSVADFEP